MKASTAFKMLILVGRQIADNIASLGGSLRPQLPDNLWHLVTAEAELTGGITRFLEAQNGETIKLSSQTETVLAELQKKIIDPPPETSGGSPELSSLVDGDKDNKTRIAEMSAELSVLLERQADLLPEGREQNIYREMAVDTALLSGDEERAGDLSARWEMPGFEDEDPDDQTGD